MIRVVALKIRSVFFYNSRKLLLSILNLSLAHTIITIIQAFLLSTILVDAFQDKTNLQDMQPMIYWLGLTFLLRAFLAFISERNIAKNSHLISAQIRSEVIEKISKNGTALEKKFGNAKLVDLVIHEIASVNFYFRKFLPHFISALILPFIFALTITSQDLISGALTLSTLLLITILRVFVGKSYTSIISKRSLFKISILELITLLSIAVILIQTLYRMNSGDISLSHGFTVLILLLQIYQPLKILTISPENQLFKIFLNGKKVRNEIHEIIDFENRDLGEIINIGKLKELRWTDASFKSSDDGALDFRWGIASAGKLTVITGSDEVGKTTLIHSIIRIKDLEKGRIFIEGSKDTHRVDQLDLNYWLRQISWVPKSPFFTRGTIEENLKLIKSRSNKEILSDLLSQVNLTVEELPEGLTTKIYSEQGGLSRSQLQRLAIGRSILKDAPIFIFDDFSTSLDLENQKFFHIVLKDLARKGKVVLAITDNVDLLELADRVISFDAIRETSQP